MAQDTNPEGIKGGDTVYLKSGSPMMTAGDVTMNGSFMCHWFFGREARAAQFHGYCLTKQKPADPDGMFGG